MNTQLLNEKDIQQAAAILRDGGLVGIPTETVYGLGANGLNPQAVARIFQAKGRPQDNPLILHIPSIDHLDRYCKGIPYSLSVSRTFLARPADHDSRPAGCSAGCGHRRPGHPVGMRCPAHALCRAILRDADVPVAAPLGNTSGRPSPTSAAHMWEDMDGKIDAIVDGGPCAVGVESTIVDLSW